MQRLMNCLGRNNVRQDDDNAVLALDPQPGPSGSAAGSSRASVAGLPARVRNGAGSAMRSGRAATTLGTPPLSFDARLAQWESAAPPGEEAARRTAVERVQHLVRKWFATSLDLHNLGLKSLPPLPDKLKHLDVNHNRLTTLPVLPSGLTELSAFNNRLTTLPALPSKLGSLFVSDNYLTDLPALPKSLERLWANDNLLQTFPIYPKKLHCVSINKNPFDPALCPPREPAHDSSYDFLADQIRAWQSEHPQPTGQTIDQSTQAYLDRLVHWVDDARAVDVGGRRKAVIQILIEVRKRPPEPNLALAFTDFGLTSLPELPAGLKRLDCRGNLLATLPALPTELQDLRCGGNQLTTLPELPASLTKLKCANNSLTNLPELPANLTELDCESNQLTTLPELPAGLIDLQCGHNQLITLPLLPAGLQNLSVDGNRNLEVSLPSVAGARSDYAQQIRLWQLDNLQGRVVGILPSMVEAFLDYLLPWGMHRARATIEPAPSSSRPENLGRQAGVAPVPGAVSLAQPFNPALGSHHWHFAETENNAASFNQFSLRLTQTAEYTNAASRSGLTSRVDALVADMRTSPALRRICFGIAADATQSCGDRIALGLNDMQLARIDHMASAGHYSMRELFTMGERFFKMAALDRIVVEKIGQLRNAGLTIYPIEIRLAYQTELSSRLGLPGVVRSMLYRHHAHVSAGDISGAERQIRQMMERGEAVDFLVQWRPWRQQLERQYPEEYERVRVFNQPAREAIACQPRGMTEQRWREAFDRQAANEAAQFTDTTDRLTRAFMEEQDIG